MTFFELAMRMCLKGQYRPRTLRGGEFTLDEIKRIDECIYAHCPQSVDSMFNNWVILKSGKWFHASRATWETGGYGGTLEEVLAKIDKYYEKFD